MELSSCAGKSSLSSPFAAWQGTISIYLIFSFIAMYIYTTHDDVGLSTLPTLSVSIQVLALIFVWAKVVMTRSVFGLSAKSLWMQVLVHTMRLSSTTWLKGYIPIDFTGDFLYQMIDLCTLLMCLQILRHIHHTHKNTYQAAEDNFPAYPTVLGCFLLAVLIHPDLNDRFVFDTLWTTSMYIDTIAMLPQCWLSSKAQFKIESLTGHYMICTCLSRCCNLWYWSYGYEELAPDGCVAFEEGGDRTFTTTFLPLPESGCANIAGWAVLIAHALQVLLMADLVYYYFRALVAHAQTIFLQVDAGTCKGSFMQAFASKPAAPIEGVGGTGAKQPALMQEGI